MVAPWKNVTHAYMQSHVPCESQFGVAALELPGSLQEFIVVVHLIGVYWMPWPAAEFFKDCAAYALVHGWA
jgi:hypothetical protein